MLTEDFSASVRVLHLPVPVLVLSAAAEAAPGPGDPWPREPGAAAPHHHHHTPAPGSHDGSHPGDEDSAPAEVHPEDTGEVQGLRHPRGQAGDGAGGRGQQHNTPGGGCLRAFWLSSTEIEAQNQRTTTIRRNGVYDNVVDILYF